VSSKQFEEISKTLKMLQNDIRNKEYKEAWDLFTEDHKKAEYQTRGLKAFERQMNPKHPLDSAFTWERDDFLSLKPQKALRLKAENKYTLIAASDSQQWQIDFIKDNGQWKIDWIAGYTPHILILQGEDKQVKELPATKVVEFKPVIQIEARFFLVPPDANEFRDFFEEENLEITPASSDANLTHCILKSEQVDQFLKLVKANPHATRLTAPKVTVLDGESATMRIQKEIDYISGYIEPNSTSGEPQPKQDSAKIGTVIKVMPKLRPDSENILIDFEWEVSNLTGEYEKHIYKEKYPYEIPIVQKIATSTRLLIGNDQTGLLSGWKMKQKDEQLDRIAQKELVVLIKVAARKPRAAIRRPADAVVYKQLEQTVDLSALTPETPFVDAIEELKSSVRPPLNIIVFWRDLYENADIDETTPINIDGIPAIKLSTALKLLLRSVSGDFADEVGYVVEDGIITIATGSKLPKRLETRLYDSSTLPGRPADYHAR